MAAEHIDDNFCEAKELTEIDRSLAIAKRLEAISESVSFHSEFLRYFTEMRSSEETEDESSDETAAEDNDAVDNRQNVECSNIKDDEADIPNETDHSNGDIGQYSAESNIDAAPSFVDTSDSQGQGSLSSDSPDAESEEIATRNYDDATSVGDSPDGRVHGSLASDSPSVQSEISRTTGSIEVDNDVNCRNLTDGETKKKKLNIQYCYKFNLFSTEFLYNCELTKVKQTNEAVLFVMPNNFNALWNKVKLMIAIAGESGDCIDETVEEILNQLEQTVSQNGKQLLIAKAEIAGMYSNLIIRSESSDPLSYCIRLYEEVLAETKLRNQNERLEEVEEKKLVAFWKCDLVATYAKLTNANKELLASYGFHHGEVLSRLEELVLSVDNSEHIANKLKAQTWVNLANTFEHYKRNYPKDRFRQSLYDGQIDLADCFANASANDPDNSRILMRTGRELRQRSNSEQDLHQAIRFFERALKGEKVDDMQGIIYHHMGLTYRSLWRLTEPPITDSTINDAYHSTRTARPDHTRGCRVIKPPDFPLDFDLIPPPYKTPPKAAYWKIINPIARDLDNPYLLQAREYFRKAILLALENNELSNSLYLMEIARTYLSAGNVEKARKCFLKTEQQPRSDIIDVDFVGSQLYENIGLLEETEMLRKEFNEVEAEKVKSCYRESIRFSTISKTKPIVAFHYLLRILYKQLERCVERNLAQVDQMIIQNEYFLLYMAIQEADDGRDIVNCVATDDFRVALIWRLIEMFHVRNQLYDAAAAFTYLSILAIAKKLTTDVKGINTTSVEKERILIRTAEKVTLQRIEQPRFLPEPYRELHVLRDVVEDDASDCNNVLHTLTDTERRKLNIVMKIIQPEFSPGYTRLSEQCYLGMI